MTTCLVLLMMVDTEGVGWAETGELRLTPPRLTTRGAGAGGRRDRARLMVRRCAGLAASSPPPISRSRGYFACSAPALLTRTLAAQLLYVGL